MVILIVASNKDVASGNMAHKLIEEYDFQKTSQLFQGNRVYNNFLANKEVTLVTIEDEPVSAQYITDFFKPELIIFVSRHQSQSGTPTLSVHTPGNLGEAEAGGIPRKVSVSPANPMRKALREMVAQRKKLGLEEYSVSYEGTHHGPSLDVATMFVEVGSTTREWEDPRAAEAVAHAAIAAIRDDENIPAALGIGGPHYNMKFTELSLRGELALGHMIPKYAAHLVDARLLKHCVERTLERVETVVLDWKGIASKDKAKVIQALKVVPVEVRRLKDFR